MGNRKARPFTLQIGENAVEPRIGLRTVRRHACGILDKSGVAEIQRGTVDEFVEAGIPPDFECDAGRADGSNRRDAI